MHKKFINANLWNFLANGIVRFLSILVYPVLVSSYAKGVISEFKTFQSIIVICFTLIPLGSNFLFISDGDKREQSKQYLFFAHLFGGFLAFTSFFVFKSYFIKTLPNFYSHYLFHLFIIIFILLELTKAYLSTLLSSNLNFKEISISLLIRQLSVYILIFILQFFVTSIISLISILLFSEMVEVILLSSYSLKARLKLIPLSWRFENLAEKIKYLVYVFLEKLVNTVAVQAPILFAVSAFGSFHASEFQLTIAAIEIPAALFSSTISKVMFPYLSNMDSKNYKDIVKPVYIFLTITLVPIFYLISVYSTEIVNIFFDPTWMFAKFCLKYTAIMLIFKFYSNTISFAAPMVKKPIYQLIYSIFLFLIRIIVFVIIGSKIPKENLLFIFILSDIIIRLVKFVVDLALLDYNFFAFLKDVSPALLTISAFIGVNIMVQVVWDNKFLPIFSIFLYVPLLFVIFKGHVIKIYELYKK